MTTLHALVVAVALMWSRGACGVAPWRVCGRVEGGGGVAPVCGRVD